MMRFISSVLVLDGIYLLALDSAHPWDIALGAVLAAFVYYLFGSWVFPFSTTGQPTPQPPIWKRILHAPAFVFVEIVNITLGTWKVMLAVLRIRPYQQGIVGLPYGDRSESGLVVMGYADTLSPGSVIVDFDDEQRMAWTHVIDASDPESTRKHTDEFYERWQKDVFP